MPHYMQQLTNFLPPFHPLLPHSLFLAFLLYFCILPSSLLFIWWSSIIPFSHLTESPRYIILQNTRIGKYNTCKISVGWFYFKLKSSALIYILVLKPCKNRRRVLFSSFLPFSPEHEIIVKCCINWRENFHQVQYS